MPRTGGEAKHLEPVQQTMNDLNIRTVQIILFKKLFLGGAGLGMLDQHLFSIFPLLGANPSVQQMGLTAFLAGEYTVRFIRFNRTTYLPVEFGRDH